MILNEPQILKLAFACHEVRAELHQQVHSIESVESHKIDLT